MYSKNPYFKTFMKHRNRFQGMNSASVPSPHRLFKNTSSGYIGWRNSSLVNSWAPKTFINTVSENSLFLRMWEWEMGGGEVGGGVKRGGGWRAGGIGGDLHPHIWTPDVAKSQQKPTIPDILEKS
jgi:hypothetical protein